MIMVPTTVKGAGDDLIAMFGVKPSQCLWGVALAEACQVTNPVGWQCCHRGGCDPELA